MIDRGTRLKLGGFVAVTLLVLAGLVVLFGGAPTVFASRARYTVSFPEAPGVGVGTPVRKSGVRVGEVTQLDLDDDTGAVAVSVQFDGKYRPRDTDEATITRGLLSGDTAVDFVPRLDPAGAPMGTGQVFPPGSRIEGVAPPSPSRLLKGAQDVLPNAQQDIARVIAIFQRFEQAVPRIEKAVDEIGGLARGGREFVPELRNTNVKVQELLGANVQEVPNDPVTVRQALKEVIDLLREIRPAAADIRSLVRDNGPEVAKTLQSIRRTSDSVNEVLTPENKKSVTNTLRNTETATGDLIRTIRLSALLIDQAERAVKEINARLAQAEVVLSGAGRVIGNAERASAPVADAAPGVVQGVQQTVKNVVEASANANQAVSELRTTLAGVLKLLQQGGQGGGTVQKALSDPSLYNNLNDTAVNLNRVIVRLDKVAQDLEVFSDKIARRPESLGLSGVVKPNTGLKDPPNAPPSAPYPPQPLAPSVPALPSQGQPVPLYPAYPGYPVPAPGVVPIAPVPITPGPLYPVGGGAGELPPRRG